MVGTDANGEDSFSCLLFGVFPFKFLILFSMVGFSCILFLLHVLNSVWSPFLVWWRSRGVLEKLIDGRSWAEDLSHCFVFPGFVTGLEVSLELIMWGCRSFCYCDSLRSRCSGFA